MAEAVKDLRFRVWSFGFRVLGFSFRVSGFGFRVSGLGSRVSGFVSRFRVSGFGLRILGFGFWVSGFSARASFFWLRRNALSLFRDERGPRAATITWLVSRFSTARGDIRVQETSATSEPRGGCEPFEAKRTASEPRGNNHKTFNDICMKPRSESGRDCLTCAIFVRWELRRESTAGGRRVMRTSRAPQAERSNNFKNNKDFYLEPRP